MGQDSGTPISMDTRVNNWLTPDPKMWRSSVKLNIIKEHTRVTIQMQIQLLSLAHMWHYIFSLQISHEPLIKYPEKTDE